ncbi:MAG: hypothetical protein ACRD1R_11285 [Acidobacteriota bacterium]
MRQEHIHVRSLQARSERIQALVHYEDRLRDILRLGLIVESLSSTDLLDCLSVRRQYGLLTNDAIFIAVAFRLGIKKSCHGRSVISESSRTHPLPAIGFVI